MVQARSVLVVDDDRPMREMLVSLLEDERLDAAAAASAEEALTRIADREFDVVLSDVRMPGQGGIELLAELRELRPRTPVILMTAFGSIDSAVAAMRAGAFDYVTKPFKRDEVLATLERALEHRELERENQKLRRAVDRSTSFGDVIGASPAMHEIFAQIRKISGSTSTVLITGESGTGKDVLARAIHFTGARATGGYGPNNCTAMPEGLLESELFGHVRGAFTGAHATKKGLFEEASGGTLFLDEIGDMPLGLQAKLLRVLQDGEIRPVGGNRSVKVDARIVAATNQELKERIEQKRFRQDLYYRLNVIPIHVPPLRERPEDIPPLVEAFARRHAGREPCHFTPEAIARLVRLPWVGNARELENVVERAIALAESHEIGPDDLCIPSDLADERPGTQLLAAAREEHLTLRELDDRYTEDILRMTGGNKVRAAEILGINRRTLYRRGVLDPEAGPEPEDEGDS